MRLVHSQLSERCTKGPPATRDAPNMKNVLRVVQGVAVAFLCQCHDVEVARNRRLRVGFQDLAPELGSAPQNCALPNILCLSRHLRHVHCTAQG